MNNKWEWAYKMHGHSSIVEFWGLPLEFSSSIRQLVGLGGLFCQLNVTEQGSLVTMI